MSYLIDGFQVNARGDWHQQYVAGAMTDRRSETFPGDGSRHVVIGQQKPPGVVVTGFLEAASFASLKGSLDFQAGRLADRTPRTVSVHGAVYTNQLLVGFKQTGGFVAFSRGTLSYKVRVQYTWAGVSA